ncbi:outer membrane protein assembly factor BamD [Paludibacter sp. 221]|uniref:tetratricopeptide repeat protein n=1 Tax=Paludibacter sp. 221 TaxID=2302939 RepID=UPI0013D4C81F|nr:tetratricopeptide repeat protein [Paludibacter sp. 221]NDV46321.1 outer membrane protein assembly factor BamD [Paludibacter sp. 221]
MKKTIVFSLLLCLGLFGLSAQNTHIFTSSDNSFDTGKELFNQGKYAAANRYFEDFLKDAKPTQAGKIQEAEYYVIAAAYELRVKDADEQITRYLQKHPYSPFADQANFMLGMIMFEQKKYQRTLNYFKKVNEKKLNSHDLTEKIYCEAYALLQTKSYTRASALFKSLKEKNTRYNTSANYYYAYSEYVQGNFDVALPVFLELENLTAYKQIVPYYIIQIYYNKGEYDKVGSRAETLLSNDPDNPNNAEIYRIVGEIAYKQGNYEKTITSLKKYESISPQVLRNDIYLLGLSYYQTRDYANAILYLSRVTTLQDQMTENAYLHIGNSYIKQKDIPNARMAYEAALSTNFDKTVREEALYNYALTTYESNSAFGESIKAFESLLREFPESKYADSAYDYLSAVYVTTQNYQAAYESIKKIKKPTSKLIETQQYLLNQMGAEDFSRKNYDSAVEKFTLALEQTPNKKYAAESLFWRAESYYRLGKPEHTITDLNAFYQNPFSNASPNLKSSYYLSGYAYFATKQYETALNWFQKYASGRLSAKDPTYADAMNRMGDCYFYERDFTNAEKSYNKAIVASPQTGDYPMFQVAYVNGLQKKYTTKITNLEKLITQYPRSQYADDAMYEIGRAYLMLENNDRTLATYQRLLDNYPNSNLAPKAALERGMIYSNKNDLNQAIESFKYVISRYPGSEESRTALESLETAYIEKNNVASYIEYTKSLGGNVQTVAVSKEDSLTFIAAEKQYLYKHYDHAIEGLTAYISKYCDNGSPVCTTARYYLADSYYQTNEKDKALTEYELLAAIAGNKYMEEAVMRTAEISYDKQEYDIALNYFSQLQEIAHNTENKNIGRLGVLRCSYFLHNHQQTIDIATEIVDDTYTNDDVKLEARYNRAKAYIALNKKSGAIADLQVLSNNARTRNGAEAKYLLSEIYYEQGKLDESENVILDFAQKNTPYQYWLARSFVVLADIYIKKGDDFQAKQYLLSLQKNYTTQDDIQEMIKERLDSIGLREQENIIN